MADDMFGDSELFAEFDKERETSGSFILYEKDEQGYEDRSKYVFQVSESSSSEDSDEDEEKLKVKQSVAFAVDTLQKQNERPKNADFNANGQVSQENGIENQSDSDTEQVDTRIVSKDRQEKMTTYKLNFERNKFKRYCNIIDSTRFIHDEESTSVQVLFQNNRFSRKYKTQIEEFVKHLIDQDASAEYETLQKLDLKSSVPSCSELNDKIPIGKRTDRMYQGHAIIGCSQFYRDFIVDTLGWPLVEYNPSLTESWDIPVYEQVLTDVLPIDEEERRALARKLERERMKPKCWNCDGEHMLNECKLPKNQAKINENRQIMMANKQQKRDDGPKSARYHKEKTSGDPKYSKFKPGVIRAGLDDDQLPVYIYKMRALGYPPGWMEEAKAAPVLSMFDKDGNDIDENVEEGETGKEPVLNVQKIIEYPGFTVETPADIADEAEMYGLPPLQPHQLKATLIAHTKMQQEAMKRELDEQETKTAKRQKVSTDDMDLDEDGEMKAAMIDYNPPLPPETPPSRPPMPLSTPPPTPDETSRQSSVNFSRESSQPRSDSPSLEELEEKYKLLQKSLMNDNEDGELIVLDSCDDESSLSSPAGEKSTNPIDVDSCDDGGTSKNPIEIANDSMDSTEDFDFVKPQLLRTGSTASIQTFGELGTGSPASSNPGTPVHTPTIDYKPTFKGTVSVSKDYGTPILKRAGSIDALPTDSKFAQGIEDHIPFENLPDSTGRFSTIRKIVDKIRKIKPMNKKKK
ncbi:zinc finger CCHC domain-containing protein 8-like [Mercenaria mercenaria]|uniref:zinc finger CCHC domain-containing protein 8-like n=1 Tax=Mercenaria mercenaria TaxID=6596 RepID=UPI00234E7A14|nr:zinc finger CCHC domain-containing protein 8-like [Mercenaria mercenaria]